MPDKKGPRRTASFHICYADDDGRIVSRMSGYFVRSLRNGQGFQIVRSNGPTINPDAFTSSPVRVVVSANSGTVMEVSGIEGFIDPGAIADSIDRERPQFPTTTNATSLPRYSEQLALPRVPSSAETLISYVCTPDRLEAVLGDLERNFVRRAAKHREKAARRWYWWQTARTVAAFGVEIVVKLVMVRELLRKSGL